MLFGGCSFVQKNPFYTQLDAVPAVQTNKKEFKAQYKANKAEWDAAFEFLKNNDLATLELGRHDITANGTYANVQEYTTRDAGPFEAHRAYIDIQYVVSGQEVIEVAPLKKVFDETQPYSEENDCVLFASAKTSDEIVVNPQVFSVLFPSDAHKPCMTYEKQAQIKKVVVKVPYVK